jgi:ArsR family transcriptional regulator, arsenate/arsenite/antimonite-responsive transcriptional repressor
MTTTTPPSLPVRAKGCCVPPTSLLPSDRAAELAAIFKALADPTRVQMLHILREAKEPVCVCDFTAAVDLGQPTVSHHLKKLQDAGLVESRRQGVWSYWSLRAELSEEWRSLLALVL